MTNNVEKTSTIKEEKLLLFKVRHAKELEQQFEAEWPNVAELLENFMLQHEQWYTHNGFINQEIETTYKPPKSMHADVLIRIRNKIKTEYGFTLDYGDERDIIISW